MTSPAVAIVHALAYGPADAAADVEVAGEGWSARVVRVVGDDDLPPGADPSVTRRRDREAGDRGPQVSREAGRR